MNRAPLLGLLLPLLLASCGGGTPSSDTQKPTVLLTLTDVVQEGGIVKASATATDNVKVREVRFYVNDQLVETDTTAPYETALKLPVAGVYNVRAVAVDTSGNESAPDGQMLTVTGGDTTPPTASLVGPQDVRTAAPVTFKVEATDNVGVARVIFYEGNTEIAEVSQAPYELTRSFTPADNGTHTYRAVVYDAAGNSAESRLTFRVNVSGDTVRPEITLDMPETVITAPGVINLGFSATDNVGVVKVDLQLIAQTALGNETRNFSFEQSSGSIQVPVTREMNGTYTLSAVAYDAAGNVSARVSQSMKVQIP